MSYSCHSVVSPMNRRSIHVQPYTNSDVKWEYRFTRDCQYVKTHNDDGCHGCNSYIAQYDDWNESRIDVLGQNGNDGLHYEEKSK